MNKKLIFLFSPVALAAIFGAVHFAFFFSRPEKISYDQNYQNNLNQLKNVQLSDSETESEVKKEPPKLEEVSLMAVGDVMLSRNVAKKMKAHGNDYPFLETAEYLKTGDIVFGNLETPITSGREIQTGEMIFRADPGVEKALAEANFSILSLANNHTPNFGEKGLKDTFKYLNQAGIKFAGAGENVEEANSPVYLEQRGLKFAFLAYNSPDVVPKSYFAGENHAGTAPMDIEKMTEAVKKAKENSDFVIVSMHAGNEYVQKPNQFQINFAHAAIDAGAELVIGHHPHVLETVEKYNGKYIFYSLGNFVFDQMWSEATREGVIVKITFNKNGVIKTEFVPTLIEDYCQPKILEGKDAEKILEFLKLPED
jgi:poly-gamma-glutamate synthesis protein (capsule biosynthesis protein)